MRSQCRNNAEELSPLTSNLMALGKAAADGVDDNQAEAALNSLEDEAERAASSIFVDGLSRE
jgi:hypothetical protein